MENINIRLKIQQQHDNNSFNIWNKLVSGLLWCVQSLTQGATEDGGGGDDDDGGNDDDDGGDDDDDDDDEVDDDAPIKHCHGQCIRIF